MAAPSHAIRPVMVTPAARRDPAIPEPASGKPADTHLAHKAKVSAAPTEDHTAVVVIVSEIGPRQVPRTEAGPAAWGEEETALASDPEAAKSVSEDDSSRLSIPSPRLTGGGEHPSTPPRETPTGAWELLVEASERAPGAPSLQATQTAVSRSALPHDSSDAGPLLHTNLLHTGEAAAQSGAAARGSEDGPPPGCETERDAVRGQQSSRSGPGQGDGRSAGLAGDTPVSILGPAAWWDPWRQAAAETATLLVSDASAGTAGEEETLGDLYGPLWGLVFSRTVSRPPGFKQHEPAVLVVQSDETSRDALMLRLTEEGYLVLSAATGREALQVLRTPLSPIGVIVLDTHLPDISAPQLYQRLRELYPRLPAVVCTGPADPSEIDQLRQLGVQHYLPVPAASDQVLATVQALLR